MIKKEEQSWAQEEASADPLQSQRQTSFVGHLLIQQLPSFWSWVTCTSVLWLGAGRQHSELEISKKAHKTMSRNCTCISCVHKTWRLRKHTVSAIRKSGSYITFMKAVKRRTHLGLLRSKIVRQRSDEQKTKHVNVQGNLWSLFLAEDVCLLLNQRAEYKSLDLCFHLKHLF